MLFLNVKQTREQTAHFGMLFPAILNYLHDQSVSSGNVHEAPCRESHERDREIHGLLHDRGHVTPVGLHAREGVCAHGGVRARESESARECAQCLHGGAHDCGNGRGREHANARVRDCLPCVWTPFNCGRAGGKPILFRNRLRRLRTIVNKVT
jgi:hypothetical protein